MSEQTYERVLDLLGGQPSLWVALRSIVERPNEVLKVERPFVGVGEAQHLEASMLGASALESGALAYTDRMRHFTSKGCKWRFLNVYDRRIVRDTDNDANRFVAYFVRYSLKLLRQTMSDVSLQSGEDADLLLVEFSRLIHRFNRIWEQMPGTFKYATLRVLPLDNQLLQFHPHYHVILTTYLACESL